MYKGQLDLLPVIHQYNRETIERQVSARLGDHNPYPLPVLSKHIRQARCKGRDGCGNRDSVERGEDSYLED